MQNQVHTTNTENWSERFDEMIIDFPVGVSSGKDLLTEADIQTIKKFIADELERQAQEVRKRILDCMPAEMNDGDRGGDSQERRIAQQYWNLYRNTFLYNLQHEAGDK